MREIWKVTVGVLIIAAVGVTSADARRRKYRFHVPRHVVIVPPDANVGFRPGELRERHYHRGRRQRFTYDRPPEGALSEETGGDRRTIASVVPSDWQLQPADPNWQGQRFLSPDGQSSFAMYTASSTQSISDHLKTVAFVDGEEVTYLRGERTYIAVAGFKGDRIFYRKAVLACGGDRWHQIAFEYPALAKRKMDQFVRDASELVHRSQNLGCEMPVAENR